MLAIADPNRETEVTPRGLTTEQFIKAFIAELVLNDIKAIPPRDIGVRRGLKLVVDKIDERVETIMREGKGISAARPWIDTGNQLRLSPTGSVENWERAFRAAQLTFVQVGNPSYEIVTFAIDKPRAESEMASLDPEQGAFVRQIADVFVRKVQDAE